MMGIHDNTRRQLHWAPKTILLRLICRAMRLLSGGSEQWASGLLNLIMQNPTSSAWQIICLKTRLQYVFYFLPQWVHYYHIVSNHLHSSILYHLVVGSRDFQRLSLYANPIGFLAIMKGVAKAVGNGSVFIIPKGAIFFSVKLFKNLYTTKK